jgi:hypothetical protein
VRAEYALRQDEGHYGPHRYMVSAHVLHSIVLVGGQYYLEDRYVTVGKFDLDANEDPQVLTSEKQEIIARRRLVKVGRSLASHRGCPPRLAHKYGNMVSMKTTLEIPDALFRRAKSAAAEQGIPLRELISDALAEKLRKPGIEDKPWLKAFGGLCGLRKETARINEIIQAEFGQIDPEEWR